MRSGLAIPSRYCAACCVWLVLATIGWQQHGVSARQQADQVPSEQIGTLHQQSRQPYGSPRVHAALRQTGVRCGRKRVARLIREAGLVGCRRARRTRTTQSDPTHMPVPNLVARTFMVVAPNQMWVGDITYIPTWEGWLYLAVLVDARVPPWVRGAWSAGQ